MLLKKQRLSIYVIMYMRPLNTKHIDAYSHIK